MVRRTNNMQDSKRIDKQLFLLSPQFSRSFLSLLPPPLLTLSALFTIIMKKASRTKMTAAKKMTMCENSNAMMMSMSTSSLAGDWRKRKTMKEMTPRMVSSL